MSAFLPQFDPDLASRRAALDAGRARYRYNHDHVSPLAVVDQIPFDQRFTNDWLLHVGKNVAVVLGNQMELEGERPVAEFFRSQVVGLEHLISRGAELFLGTLRGMVGDALQFKGRASAQPLRPESLEDYAKMFRRIGLPPVNARLGDDATFAQMRLAGPNPVMLQRVAALDDRIPLSDALYQVAMPGDTLAAAGAEGRLFLADYQQLGHIGGSPGPDGTPKYLYAPLAVFAVDRATRHFRPVAIQCAQAPGETNPIFTPGDGNNWLIAKTIVEIADGNVHEAVTHLGRTHMLVEPFAISSFRQLAPTHPIFVLLMPHFEGTMAINDAAWRHLIADKGAVARLLGGTIEESRGLTAAGLRSYHFRDGMLPRSLRARGVDDPTWLASYPYRDDALLYWDAIAAWVLDYLALYYPSDQEVADDTELCAWIDEIGAADGGRIVGFERAPSATLAGLAETLTMILFTCSVQHAAVNFPQYSLMSYAPMMPLAGYAPRPTSKTGATDADRLAMLPPLDVAELQMELGYLLGTVHYTTLGQYRGGHFVDPRVAAPLAKFQARLDARNLERMPYDFLTRSGIPQSINI